MESEHSESEITGAEIRPVACFAGCRCPVVRSRQSSQPGQFAQAKRNRAGQLLRRGYSVQIVRSLPPEIVQPVMLAAVLRPFVDPAERDPK